MIPANGTITYEHYFRGRNGERKAYTRTAPLVGFDSDGAPLTLAEGNRATPVSELGDPDSGDALIYQPPVAATPGWYALIVYHMDEDESIHERRPVVAWVGQLGTWGEGEAILLDPTPFGDGGDAGWLGTTTAVLGCSNGELAGYYHDELLPQPPELGEAVAKHRLDYCERERRKQERRREELRKLEAGR